MPNNTTNNPHIRLARIAFPASDPESWRGGTNSTVNNGIGRFFDPASLDSLAICERRVCEAGYEKDYFSYLWDALGLGIAGGDAPMVLYLCGIKLITATAPQRAAALLAFLDAHPAVEERLAAGE